MLFGWFISFGTVLVLVHRIPRRLDHLAQCTFHIRIDRQRSEGLPAVYISTDAEFPLP